MPALNLTFLLLYTPIPSPIFPSVMICDRPTYFSAAVSCASPCPHPTPLCPFPPQSSLLTSLQPSSQAPLLPLHGLPCLWARACNAPQLQAEKQSGYPQLARLSGRAPQSAWDLPSPDCLSAWETCCHSAASTPSPDQMLCKSGLIWSEL